MVIQFACLHRWASSPMQLILLAARRWPPLLELDQTLKYDIMISAGVCECKLAIIYSWCLSLQALFYLYYDAVFLFRAVC